MKSNESLPWQEFEKRSVDILGKFFAGATVTPSDKITGQNSHEVRKIDISIRQRIGVSELFLIVDCKKRNRKTGVQGMGEFISLKEDVGAHLGILINEKGFTKGAKTLAKRSHVQTLVLLDSKADKRLRQIRLPVCLDVWYLTPLRVEYEPVGTGKMMLHPNQVLSFVDEASGREISLREIVQREIAKFDCPKDGVGRVECSVGAYERGQPDTLSIFFRSEFSRFFKDVDLDFLGLHDHGKGEVYVSEAESGRVTMLELENSWKKLAPTEEVPGWALRISLRVATDKWSEEPSARVSSLKPALSLKIRSHS